MIRAATLDDVPALVEMGERFRSSTGYQSILPANREQFTTMATRLVNGPESTVLLLDEAGPVGMIGLIKYVHHLSGQPVVGEVMWWLEPEHRGHGTELLVAAERWAAQAGAVQLHMIAPDDRVGVLYRRKGYQLFETTYYKNLIPATAAIHVFDDVMADLPVYRSMVLQQTFGDVETSPGCVFHGLAPIPDERLADWLRQQFPMLQPRLSFVRKSPEHQQEPNFIHTDRDMGEWTAIAYLTEAPAKGDGTCFWRYKPTGAIASTSATEDEFLHEWLDWRKRELWEPWHLVEAKPNRVVVFPAPYFHSRAIEDNYGIDESARLIQVIFGIGELPCQ